MSDKIQKAYKIFRKTGIKSELLKILKQNPCSLPDHIDYPEIHRIEDINFGDCAYRVNRVWKNGKAEFCIVPCTTPNFKGQGVPYKLTGWRLDKWIQDEKELEDDEDYDPCEPTNWSYYLKL